MAIYLAYGYPDKAYAHFKAAHTVFENWEPKRELWGIVDNLAGLMYELFDSQIGCGNAENALELLGEIEKRVQGRFDDWAALMWCKEQMLSLWFAKKEYAKVVEKADTNLKHLETLAGSLVAPHQDCEAKDAYEERAAALAKQELPSARLAHLYWKARARFELGDKEGLLDEMLAVVNLLESDKSYPDSDSYNQGKWGTIAHAYSKLADLADAISLTEKADGYRKLAEENGKKVQECDDRMKPRK